MKKTMATLAAVLLLAGCGEAHGVPPVLTCDGVAMPGPVRWVRVGESESVRISECQAREDVIATAQARADELGCTVAVVPSEREWCDYPQHLEALVRIDEARDCGMLSDAVSMTCAMPIWRPL